LLDLLLERVILLCCLSRLLHLSLSQKRGLFPLCHPRENGGLYKSIQFLDSLFRGNDGKGSGMTTLLIRHSCTPLFCHPRQSMDWRGSMRILDSRCTREMIGRKEEITEKREKQREEKTTIIIKS